MMTGSIVVAGFVASLATGIATGIGALPLFLVRRISARLEDVFLGFAAGVMLAAAFFSLIIPALDVAEARFAGKIGAALVVIAALALGAGAMWFIHERAPHEHMALGRDGPLGTKLRRIWLSSSPSPCTTCRKAWRSASASAAATRPTA
jgi:zinc transporter, ZIP family